MKPRLTENSSHLWHAVKDLQKHFRFVFYYWNIAAVNSNIFRAFEKERFLALLSKLVCYLFHPKFCDEILSFLSNRSIYLSWRLLNYQIKVDTLRVFQNKIFKSRVYMKDLLSMSTKLVHTYVSDSTTLDFIM